MPESQAHKRGKGRAKQTEVPISRNRRLDAKTPHYAIEVERSGSRAGLRSALMRLRTQSNKRKILRVPQKDMDMATDEARQLGINARVTNMSKTKSRQT